VQQSIAKNKSLEEENKWVIRQVIFNFVLFVPRQQILHLETVNMMTKYQIVYIKLETTLYNIIRQTEQKKAMRVKKAFQRMKYSVTQSDKNLN